MRVCIPSNSVKFGEKKFESPRCTCYNGTLAMKVYVDNKEVEVFAGAKAADAARAAGVKRIAKLYDAYGNEIAPDSPMKAKRKIFTAKPKD